MTDLNGNLDANTPAAPGAGLLAGCTLQDWEGHRQMSSGFTLVLQMMHFKPSSAQGLGFCPRVCQVSTPSTDSIALRALGHAGVG